MIDHSTLPAVQSARLPETYENARNALAECQRIDECQSWADKSEALASYAKQADDDSLRKMADRIQARAIRRMGELYKQMSQGRGGDRKSCEYQSAGTHTSIDSARKAVGQSRHKAYQAIRVATVPDEEFERQVESDNPPTVTKLAEMGKRQIVDLKGRDPKEFNTALHFVAAFERHLKECGKHDVLATVEILNDGERERLRKAIAAIDAIHDQIMTRI